LTFTFRLEGPLLSLATSQSTRNDALPETSSNPVQVTCVVWGVGVAVGVGDGDGLGDGEGVGVGLGDGVGVGEGLGLGVGDGVGVGVETGPHLANVSSYGCMPGDVICTRTSMSVPRTMGGSALFWPAATV
jgi:hypothetical protein